MSAEEKEGWRYAELGPPDSLVVVADRRGISSSFSRLDSS
jgi:hypothetical protein